MATTTWPEYLGQLNRYLASARLSIERDDPSQVEDFPVARPDTPLPDELRPTVMALYRELEGLAGEIETRLAQNVLRRRQFALRPEADARPRHFSGLL